MAEGILQVEIEKRSVKARRPQSGEFLKLPPPRVRPKRLTSVADAPKRIGQDLVYHKPSQFRLQPAAPKVDKPAPEKITKVEPKTSKTRKQQRRWPVVLAMFMATMVGGFGFLVYQYHSQQAVKQSGQQAVAAQTYSGDNPSEAEPKPVIATFAGALDQPRRLIIPKIQVDSPVNALGLKSSSQLYAPSNIYETGWYRGSSHPGEQGAMLLNGHVHGPTKPGVFANLKSLIAGDKIQVMRGDGAVFTYAVVKTKVYQGENTDMALALTPVATGQPGLNIITATGTYNVKSNEDRLIVFAVLVKT